MIIYYLQLFFVNSMAVACKQMLLLKHIYWSKNMVLLNHSAKKTIKITIPTSQPDLEFLISLIAIYYYDESKFFP